jgi:hypothetical protein
LIAFTLHSDSNASRIGWVRSFKTLPCVIGKIVVAKGQGGAKTLLLSIK